MKKNKLIIAIFIMSVTFLCLIGYFAKKKPFVESGVGNKISNSFQFLTNVSNVRKENEVLRKTNSALKNKAIEYDTALRQNENIKKMLEFSNKRTNYNYIGADIIGLNENGFSDGYKINVGENRGIKKGMIVMTGDGLVGMVTIVGDNWSIVQCLVNPTIAVAAIVEGRSATSGIVRGYTDENNKLLAKMQYLSLNSTIKKGDVIVTSGLGRAYPSGIKIGKILSVQENKSDVSKIAIMQFSVDFEKLEEVFIVKSTDPSGIQY